MPASNPIRVKYQPNFDDRTDEWVVSIPSNKVRRLGNGSYKVRLPLYLTRTYLSIGGAILRPLRRRYRDWLLAEQGEKCAECGLGARADKGYWTLDHVPPLSQPGSKFIDYDKSTGNRVIHQNCDKAQTRKRDLKST
jgi:5-methylcytosine-specific restriction endonuclease McrA